MPEYGDAISLKMAEAEQKAWASLSGYKFLMFGYHAAQWVLLNQIIQEERQNPFKKLVKLAQEYENNWNTQEENDAEKK